MKKALSYIVFVLLFTSLIFLFGFSSRRNSEKKVKQISIEFADGFKEFLTQEMVDKLLIQNQEPVQNKAKSIIDLQEIEHTVVSNPFIESASVYLTIDGLLKARVKQRTPIARVYSGGDMYYLDKEGVRVPLSNHYSARVLLVTGQFEAEDDQEIKSFVQRILADDFLKKEIIGLHKTQKNEWVLDTRIGNQKIEFGSLERISVKFKKLKAFYNTTFEDQTINKYRTINLKYHNQVVCTK
ncbi:cell division protein FtsQ [Polaribacter pacificus]|uniref:Cell division protein FtsQ n=1 Tax=Polaribacter pacificus TaxID=1775173 RepID=A0A917HWX8_9FLAO|nr:cell division protein FtsQ/DivIB [Polaribacter pacificus]GGG95649.1 cell division protein FtsQ [Polaribacter pacificus]